MFSEIADADSLTRHGQHTYHRRFMNRAESGVQPVFEEVVVPLPPSTTANPKDGLRVRVMNGQEIKFLVLRELINANTFRRRFDELVSTLEESKADLEDSLTSLAPDLAST